MNGLFTEIVAGDAEEKTITVDWTDSEWPIIIGQKVILARGEPLEVMSKKIKELEEKLAESVGANIVNRNALKYHKEKLAEAIEVIRFYGNKANWQSNPSAEIYADVIEISDSDVDTEPFNGGLTGGKRAREFLAKVDA